MASHQTAIALQGGGVHGAFSWGVLDQALEQGLPIERVCGVSSGALTGVMLVQGWVHGGTEGARAALRGLWERVAVAHESHGLPLIFGWGWPAMQSAVKLFSPSQVNVFGHNPLRAIVEELLDRKALSDPDAPSLTVSATDVETGQAVTWSNGDITADVLLASCCLPQLFSPVEIDGRTYWDGGFSGNPPLAPLLRPDLPERLVLVRAQPRYRHDAPRSLEDIANRQAELSFECVLQTELAALPPEIDLVVLGDDEALAALPVESKLAGDMRLFEYLFNQGRSAARPLVSAPVN